VITYISNDSPFFLGRPLIKTPHLSVRAYYGENLEWITSREVLKQRVSDDKTHQKGLW